MLCDLQYNENQSLWFCARPGCSRGPMRCRSTDCKRTCNAGVPRSLSITIPRPITPKCLVGTELKRTLSSLGIHAEVGCKCNARAARMDREGCDWCEKNLELIVDWLEEEAKRRKLPFFRVVGRRLVKRALRNARRASS